MFFIKLSVFLGHDLLRKDLDQLSDLIQLDLVTWKLLNRFYKLSIRYCVALLFNDQLMYNNLLTCACLVRFF